MKQFTSDEGSSHGMDADVVVVGAGPAGSTAAHYPASAGVDVLVLEKTSFPREKVCGDGLTPRAVKELVAMGVPTRAQDGWVPDKGLRVVGAGQRLELPGPASATFGDVGLVRPRQDFDEILARHATAAPRRGRHGPPDQRYDANRPGRKRRDVMQATACLGCPAPGPAEVPTEDQLRRVTR